MACVVRDVTSSPSPFITVWELWRCERDSKGAGEEGEREEEEAEAVVLVREEEREEEREDEKVEVVVLLRKEEREQVREDEKVEVVVLVREVVGFRQYLKGLRCKGGGIRVSLGLSERTGLQ